MYMLKHKDDIPLVAIADGDPMVPDEKEDTTTLVERRDGNS